LSEAEERERRKLLFTKYSVSVWDNKNAMKMNGGDGCKAF
jgi:hypothetical protein